MKELGIIHDSTELRKLIAENPNLPIAIMVAQDSASEDYCYTYCSDISCSVAEVLDYDLPFGNGHVFEDKIEFQEAIENELSDFEEFRDMTDAEFNKAVEAEMRNYEQHWKKVILVRVGN